MLSLPKIEECPKGVVAEVEEGAEAKAEEVLKIRADPETTESTKGKDQVLSLQDRWPHKEELSKAAKGARIRQSRAEE